ncbi:unnamed protein product, partial [Strongylus vulgaris]
MTFKTSKKFSIKKEYVDLITEKYSARIKTLDFQQTEETAKIIDDFVSNATENKIKNFITEDSVKDGFSLIVNAIYFKAKWLYEFQKQSTKKRAFYFSETNKKEIDFLGEIGKNRLYAENEDVEVLSLPYKD